MSSPNPAYITIVPPANSATLDATLGDTFVLYLWENCNLTVAGMEAEQRVRLIVVQAPAGGNTLTFVTEVLWPSGTAPVVTVTGNQWDVFDIAATPAGFLSSSSTAITLYGAVVGQNY